LGETGIAALRPTELEVAVVLEWGLPCLRPAVAWRLGVESIPAAVVLRSSRPWRRSIATRILGWASATVPVIRTLRTTRLRFGPPIAFSARLLRALIRASFHAWTALTTVAGIPFGPPRTVAVAAPLFGRLWTRSLAFGSGVPALRPPISRALGAVRALAAGRTELFRLQLSVAVAVKFAENVPRMVEFLGVDHAVVIRIERAEEPGHGTRSARPFRSWTDFAGGSAVLLRRSRRARREIFLRAERESRQRAGDCGGENVSGFHGEDSWG
jgi:hypothetical protein